MLPTNVNWLCSHLMLFLKKDFRNPRAIRETILLISNTMIKYIFDYIFDYLAGPKYQYKELYNKTIHKPHANNHTTYDTNIQLRKTIGKESMML